MIHYQAINYAMRDTNKRRKIAHAFINTIVICGFALAMLYLNNPKSFEEFWVIHLPELLRGVVN